MTRGDRSEPDSCVACLPACVCVVLVDAIVDENLEQSLNMTFYEGRGVRLYDWME